MTLPALPEAIHIRRNAHGFTHSFSHLQMDAYGRECAAESTKSLRGQQAVLIDLLRECLSVLNTIDSDDCHEVECLSELEIKCEKAIEGAIE